MLATPDLTQRFITGQRALDFCKWLSCLYECGMSPERASRRFLERWRPSADAREIVTKSIDFFAKAAVTPGRTDDPSWAGSLVGVREFAEAFVSVARSASLLGRIPRLRNVPFNTNVPVQTQPANYYWVQQSAPKPVAKFSFNNGITLEMSKHAGIVPVTKELLKLAAPGTEEALRDELINGLSAFTDLQFIDPAVAGVPGVSPPSVTHGTAPIAGTGDLAADVGALLDQFFAGRPGAVDAVLIMAPGNAAKLPELTAPSVPIVKSEAAGPNVIAMDPRGVLVADGGIDFDMSEQATLQLDNAPVSDGTAVLTSAWRHNLVAIKTERAINYEAVPGAVRYLVAA